MVSPSVFFPSNGLLTALTSAPRLSCSCLQPFVTFVQEAAVPSGAASRAVLQRRGSGLRDLLAAGGQPPAHQKQQQQQQLAEGGDQQAGAAQQGSVARGASAQQQVSAAAAAAGAPAAAAAAAAGAAAAAAEAPAQLERLLAAGGGSFGGGSKWLTGHVIPCRREAAARELQQLMPQACGRLDRLIASVWQRDLLM